MPKELRSLVLMAQLRRFVQGNTQKTYRSQQTEGCVWRSVNRRQTLRVPAGCSCPRRKTAGDRHRWSGCSDQLVGDEWDHMCFVDAGDDRSQRERVETLG